MIRFYFTVLLAIISVNLFSFTEHDKNIAESLIESSNEISYQLIDEVLEFDPQNQFAIKEKVKLLYSDNKSFEEILNLIDMVTGFDREIKFIELEINYRLGNYKKIVKNISKYQEVYKEKADFYKIDSYIRIGAKSLANEILKDNLLTNPYSILLNELNYLLNKDSGSLRLLRENINGFNSLVRLFNRLNKDERGYSLIEKVIRNDYLSYKIENIKMSDFNYTVLPLFKKYINENLNGEFRFDRDSNTFTDTVFEVKNGILIRKSIDINGDGIYDNEIILKDSMPHKIIYNNIELNYGSYPYVKEVVFRDESVSTLHFFNNKSIYRIEKLLQDIIIPIDDYDKSEHLDFKEVKHEKSYEKWEYRSNNTIVKYIDEENKNIYSHIVLEVNGIPVSGLRDLDFDGVCDIHEKYLGGELVGSGLFLDNKYEYYESYENFDIKIFNYDNELKFVLKDIEGNVYTLNLDSTKSFDSIINIKKDNYNWILEN